MPTLPPPRRPAAPLCIAALVLVLGACGQKGALYHPDDADAPAATATSAPAAAPPTATATPVKKDPKKPAGTPR